LGRQSRVARARAFADALVRSRAPRPGSPHSRPAH
jgi:hypothetical protein